MYFQYITNSLSLCISSTTIQIPIRYVDNPNNSNLAINLIFL